MLKIRSAGKISLNLRYISFVVPSQKGSEICSLNLCETTMKDNKNKHIDNQGLMYNGIDIFSGAGGLSIGAEMAGISMKCAVEINKSAAETYQYNHPETKVICNDIRKISKDELLDHDEDVFIIIGGPPCQGFSMSNSRSRNMDNPNNQLFKEFVRLVDELRPKWFLFENVWGITNIENGDVMEMIASLFVDLGYKVDKDVLCASSFGVPQNRERFFMVGNRIGVNFEFPAPSKNRISVWDAIKDLPILNNGDQVNECDYIIPYEEATEYAQLMRIKSQKATQNLVSRNADYVIERYKYIRPGHNWRDIPDELMGNYADKSRCHSGIYKRLNPDEPSVVISNYRKSMLIHPYQHRGLSVREAARIQSFPDSFHFCGPISHIQQQIGNAVPPLLAKAVIDQIIKLTAEHEQGQRNSSTR